MHINNRLDNLVFRNWFWSRNLIYEGGIFWKLHYMHLVRKQEVEYIQGSIRIRKPKKDR